MRARWFLGVASLLSLLLSVGGVSDVGDRRGEAVEVSCPDPRGCFMKIEEAIESTPEGSTIRIGPGTYYEKPLVIQKSLVLQGAGAYQTEIRTVDPGAGINILSSDSISVTLQGLAIVTRIEERKSEDSANVGILWVQEGEGADKEQFILIQESRIESNAGVGIRAWKGQITIQQSTIYGRAGGLGVAARGRIEVRIEKSSLIGPEPVLLGFIRPGPSLSIGVEIGATPGGRILVLLRKNEIMGWGAGLIVSSLGHVGWGAAEVLLEENKITYNGGPGVYLIGDAVAELVKNEITENKYGVELALPPCISISPQDEIAFQGIIRGSENVISNNEEGDLCPADYPWPPGFKK